MTTIKIMTRGVLLYLVAAMAVQAQDVESHTSSPVGITYHEAASALEFGVPAAITGASKPATDYRRQMGFAAFGRDFRIDLERNDRLYEALRTGIAPVAGELPVYKGELAGLPGSWARITLVDGQPVGAVWDGTELFLIDSAANFGVAPTPGGTSRDVVVVRSSDLRIPTDTLSFAGQPDQTTAKATLAGDGGGSTTTATSQPALAGALPIGLVLDAGFMAMYADAVEYALAVANVADGIFVAQLGLHLDVAHVQTYASEPDPFTGTDDEVLLEQLAQLKEKNAALRPLGLAHLFTRNELGDNIVGIAKIGRLCDSRNSVGLSRAVGGVTTALIMAHEIGHNFGAFHDGEAGSVCATTPANYLMAPSISQARQFSPCSVQSMTPLVQGASCKTTIPKSDIRIVSPDALEPVWYGEELFLDFRVHNAGNASTIQTVADFTTSNPEPVRVHDMVNRSCTATDWGPPDSCDLQSISAGQTVPVTVSLTPMTLDGLTVDAIASAANDTDSSNNAASVRLEVLPATNIEATAKYGAGPSYGKPGSIIELEAGAVNTGDFATESAITVSAGGGHGLVVPDECTPDGPARMHCDFGTLAPGAERYVDFALQMNPDVSLGLTETRIAHVYVEASSTLHDNNRTNDTATMLVRLVGSIHDLALEVFEPPQSLMAGETRKTTARILNNGPDAAPELVVATYGSGLEFSDWEFPAGDCVLEETWLNCRVERLESGESVDLAVTYTSVVPASYNFGIQAYSESGLDTDYDNAWQQFEIKVKSDAPSPAPVRNEATKDSGGGGSFGWLNALLALALLARRGRMRAGRAC